MFTFGSRSRSNLDTCHPSLVGVAERALLITPWDFSIIEGERSLQRQKRLFDDGLSHIDGISQKGKHNRSPSWAFDFMPYPPEIDGHNVWKDPMRFHYLVGIFRAAAILEGVPIRSGSDWDDDGTAADQNFHDLGHIELVGEVA